MHDRSTPHGAVLCGCPACLRVGAADSRGRHTTVYRELIVRPAKRRLTGLGAAFRKLAPHFGSFDREQPVQDRRDWTLSHSEAGSRHRPGNS